eukprot:1774629-Lingulodinium_polyedra.AAC.1
MDKSVVVFVGVFYRVCGAALPSPSARRAAVAGPGYCQPRQEPRPAFDRALDTPAGQPASVSVLRSLRGTQARIFR